MNTLIIAPHPDDEILGAGGTLKKRSRLKGNNIFWVIMTMPDKKDYDKKFILKRKKQIIKIKSMLKFKQVFELNFPSMKLDKVPKKEIVRSITDIFNKVRPEEVFVPHLGDVHSDHKVISEIISTCTKNFRFNFIKKILAYEVLSETNFNLIKSKKFYPNYYEDISDFLSFKIKAMKVYKSELKKFPFPRSIETIKALAKIRGSEIGAKAAEAFEVMKIIKN